MMSPPSNNVTLAVSASTTSSRASFPTQNDRERSRNAKAQARHRAKRKAYVEQLEQTVTRLQATMSLTNDETGHLNRIRELEEENARLRQDNIELRRELEDRSAQFLRPDIGRRTSDFSQNDSYRGDSNGTNTTAWGEFDYKKSGRLSNGSDPDRDYLLVCPPPSLRCDISPQSSIDLSSLQARPPTLSRNSMHPPPPLHIPALQYSGNSQPQQQQPQSRALYSQQNGSLTYPVTSPTSSSSSPTYSPHHLSPIASRSSGGQQHHNTLPSINEHYAQVKVEDDSYLHTPTISQPHQYPYTPNEPVSVGGNPWHAYPSERPDIQQ
ncbi:hypothetical protein BDM02DRAFT_2324164 [Thelephora ganbajun]|uniref:Uncharacterized protein n=1 Tax=Thelephora ganbajun TaxID=370292 RepID=A0ACB6ZES3_THEGA|nr:hypothetical protein BDM02DRAFT_2324164 [Thelephora ganbajun]